jgi:hypothetical protein
MKRRDIDPELRRQLDAADAGQDVWVACSLRFDPARPPEPGETERQMRALMRRVEEQTGERAGESTVFENLGTFALAAPAGFIDRLLIQPEIATAMANYSKEDVFIRPVERRPVRGPGPGRRS